MNYLFPSPPSSSTVLTKMSASAKALELKPRRLEPGGMFGEQPHRLGAFAHGTE